MGRATKMRGSVVDCAPDTDSYGLQLSLGPTTHTRSNPHDAWTNSLTEIPYLPLKFCSALPKFKNVSTFLNPFKTLSLFLVDFSSFLHRNIWRKLTQNCSLSNRRRSFEDDVPISDRTSQINSHISAHCHLEQSLDLKTGEVDCINRDTGVMVKEDNNNAYDDFSGESDVTVVSEEDSSYYESDESSSESSLENHKEESEVLVVAGCKACYMYYMVPKLLKDCPKCAAQLLHFDRHH